MRNAFELSGWPAPYIQLRLKSADGPLQTGSAKLFHGTHQTQRMARYFSLSISAASQVVYGHP